MSVKFIIDSASDILPEEASALGVTHIPLKVLFGQEEYADGVTLSHHAFYKKLAASKDLPTTCQAPPADFSSAIAPLIAEGHEIVVITLSSRLSGTYQSAVIAAEEYPGKVFVVDSLSATIGERILLQRGMALAELDLSAAQIAAILDEEKSCVKVMAIIDTLEYLKKGGRISAATALAGSVLSIKPAIEVRNGEVAMAGKARGARQGCTLLRQMIDQCGGINFSKPFSLVYSGTNDKLLQDFIAGHPELWPDQTALPICTLGCSIGTHIGPGAYGIAFFSH